MIDARMDGYILMPQTKRGRRNSQPRKLQQIADANHLFMPGMVCGNGDGICGTGVAHNRVNSSVIVPSSGTCGASFLSLSASWSFTDLIKLGDCNLDHSSAVKVDFSSS